MTDRGKELKELSDYRGVCEAGDTMAVLSRGKVSQ